MKKMDEIYYCVILTFRNFVMDVATNGSKVYKPWPRFVYSSQQYELNIFLFTFDILYFFLALIPLKMLM